MLSWVSPLRLLTPVVKANMKAVTSRGAEPFKRWGLRGVTHSITYPWTGHQSKQQLSGTPESPLLTL